MAHAQLFLPAPGSDRAGPGSPSGRAASLLLRLSRGDCVSPQLCCTHCHVPPNPCSAGTTEEHHPIICRSPGPPAAAVPPQRAPKGQAGQAGQAGEGDSSCPGPSSPGAGQALRAVPLPHATSRRPSSEVARGAPRPFIHTPRAKSKEPRVAPRLRSLLTSSPEIPAVNG